MNIIVCLMCFNSFWMTTEFYDTEVCKAVGTHAVSTY